MFNTAKLIVPCVFCLSLCWAQAASAQQRTGVVLDFGGRAGSQGRRAVVGALTGDVRLLPQSSVRSRADGLGADLDTPGGRAQVAEAMDLDLIVGGQVTGRGRRARTTIIIYDATGEEVARQEAGSPAGPGRRRVGQAAREALQQALGTIDEREASDRQHEISAEERGGGYDDEGYEDEEEEEEEPGERAPVPILEAMVGFGGRSRNATIDLEAGGAREYSIPSFLFSELSARVLLHPLAKSGGIVSGLFGLVTFFHSIGLGSEDAMGNAIGTSALRFSADVGLFAPLGGVSFGGSLGLGYDAFLLDANDTMSSAQYTYLRPGLVFAVPFMDDTLGLQLDAGLRIGLGAGDLAPMFGTSASAFGFDLMASLGGALEMGFAYALRVGYVSYSLSFDGMGAMAANTATGGSDGYLVVTLNAGWQLR